MFALLTATVSTTVCFLYPAYASYKALSLPPSSLESERALERWLMYWAVVGSWTAIEAVVGFTFNWIPFYNIIKSLIFAFLALPQSEGSSYIYHAHLAPFFQEHERDIDLFLGSLRIRAGSAFADTLTWLWSKIRTQLNMALPHEPPVEDQAQGPLPGQPYPTGNMSAGQPPTFHDQAGGLQRLYGVAARYAASSNVISYAPVAIGAVSQLANRAQASNDSQHSRPRTVSGLSGYDTSQTMEMPIPRPTPAGSDSTTTTSTIRSRAFAHASGSSGPDTWGSDVGTISTSPNDRRRPSGIESHRSSSESIQSGHSGNGGRWAEMSYEQINKDELGSGNEGQAGGGGGGRPGGQGRRTSSGRWFSWGNEPESKPKSE